MKLKITEIRNGNTFTDLLTNTEKKQITSYIVDIDTKSFELNREQLETIYRSYPNKSVNGAGLTANAIRSRYFSTYTTNEFVKIITAFRYYYGLNKNDGIFTPHEREELNEKQRWEKVVSFSKDLQKITDSVNELKNFKQLVQDQNKEISELKAFKDVVKQLLIDSGATTSYITQPVKNNKSIIITLSDMHIGCRVDGEDANFNENINYSNADIINRLNKVIDQLKIWGPFKDVWVFNLGDAIDNINNMTARQERSQIMPSSMGNKEMLQTYYKDILYFFNSMVVNNIGEHYHFRVVGDSNHGGISEWAMSVAIAEVLSHLGVDAKVSDRTFNHCLIGNKVIIYTHGKDGWNQSKALPKTLNDATTTFLNSYITENGLDLYRGNIIVLKGDSHQYCYSATNDFEYVSVGSLFGASNWAQSNFSARRWEVNLITLSNFSEPMYMSVRDKNKNNDIKFC